MPVAVWSVGAEYTFQQHRNVFPQGQAQRTSHQVRALIRGASFREAVRAPIRHGVSTRCGRVAVGTPTAARAASVSDPAEKVHIRKIEDEEVHRRQVGEMLAALAQRRIPPGNGSLEIETIAILCRSGLVPGMYGRGGSRVQREGVRGRGRSRRRLAIPNSSRLRDGEVGTTRPTSARRSKATGCATDPGVAGIPPRVRSGVSPCGIRASDPSFISPAVLYRLENVQRA